MRKRIFSLCLVLVMIFTITACGNKNTTEPTEPTPTNKEDVVNISDAVIIKDFGTEIKVNVASYDVKNVEILSKDKNVGLNSATVIVNVEAENDIATLVSEYMMEYVYQEDTKTYSLFNTELQTSTCIIKPKNYISEKDAKATLNNDWTFKEYVKVDDYVVKCVFEKLRDGSYGATAEKAINTYAFNTGVLKWELISSETQILNTDWKIDGVWYPVDENGNRDTENTLSVEISNVTDSTLDLKVTWQEYGGVIFEQTVDYNALVNEIFIVVTNTEKNIPMIQIEITVNSVKVSGNKFMLETELVKEN